MKLSNIKDLVLKILKDNPMTRNSDRLLYNEVCMEMGYDTHNMTAWEMLHRKDMPSTESVRRSRQKAQAENPELRACADVQNRRMELELEYNDRFKLANDTNYALAYLVKKIEYRPFKSTKELVEVFEKIANILPYDYKFFMPFIWIKNKGTGDKELILTFGKHEYYTENSSGDMKALLDYYTFLDGTPCGVKE